MISDQVDKDKLVQYFVVIQEIMQRFAVVWHKVANDENNVDFHTHFHETKVLNKLVILKINIIIILLLFLLNFFLLFLYSDVVRIEFVANR